jgi:hypothetical protein
MRSPGTLCIAICVVALACASGLALAQNKVDEPTTKDLKKIDPVPPATGKNQPEQAGTQEPSSKAKDLNPNAEVFVNGSLAVPGAQTDMDTVPSKFSARNAASDQLPIAAFRLKHLTDDQRREIYQHLAGGGLALSPGGAADDGYAIVGAQVPPTIALRDPARVPEAVAAKFPELRDTTFMRSGAKVLLIDPRNRLVIGVLSPQ